VEIASTAPVAIAVLTTMGSAKIADLVQKRQLKWLEAVQDRTTATSDMLTKMEGLRMLSQLSRIGKQIQALREREIVGAKDYLRVDAFKNVCASTSTLLAPVATLLIFAFAVDGPQGTGLTSSTAFYALNLISLMSTPLAILLNSLPDFAASLACFMRIQRYLEGEEKQDYRLFAEVRSPATRRASQISGDNVELSAISRSSDLNASINGAYAAAIDGGCFGYGIEERAILRDVNIHIIPGSFTVIQGPVGSGSQRF
jgi:ABC-type bacteriocin/lantibiotic exporter with double-glycine peptidase domain